MSLELFDENKIALLKLIVKSYNDQLICDTKYLQINSKLSQPFINKYMNFLVGGGYINKQYKSNKVYYILVDKELVTFVNQWVAKYE